jgi:hypothetical protein
VPFGWYDDVASVPASADTLWSSVGTRDNASLNWVWQLPIQVEGDQGPAGTDASLYYILSRDGTVIKNGTGSIRLEARKVFAGNDVLLSSGDIQLYNGSTALGYEETLDATDIAGAVVIEMKDGPSGNVYDTISLVDVADGEADTGKSAVYGYVEPGGPLAWVRAADGTTWTPSSLTLQLDVTFVQAGAEVARVGYVITRDSNGILTGAAGTHSSGDLNGSRVTPTKLSENTAVMAVQFLYSYLGDEAVVTETVLTSTAGTAGATGATGPAGTSPVMLTLSARSIALFAYQNGLVPSYAGAGGVATVWSGTTDVTASSTLSISASSNVTGATINASGAYSISGLNADNGSITIQAVYSGTTVTEKVTFFKQYAGFEIVGSLPVTNLFSGRVVFLTTDSKLYRYTGSSWTTYVNGADLQANSVTANAISAGAVTAAKISVTELSALTTNAGTITAGLLQSVTGGVRHDLTNARVLYNSAPGQTGGLVRIQGAVWAERELPRLVRSQARRAVDRLGHRERAHRRCGLLLPQDQWRIALDGAAHSR